MLEENMETLQLKKWEENFHIQNVIKRIDQRLCNKNLQIIGFHKKKLDNKSNNWKKKKMWIDFNFQNRSSGVYIKKLFL